MKRSGWLRRNTPLRRQRRAPSAEQRALDGFLQELLQDEPQRPAAEQQDDQQVPVAEQQLPVAQQGPVLRLVHSGPAELRALPKPEEPLRCEVFLHHIRGLSCLNGDVPIPGNHQGQIDPHHEGDRGVSQKCSDLLTVPLCRYCHNIFEITGALPHRGAQESLLMIQAEQLRLLPVWMALVLRALAPPSLRLVDTPAERALGEALDLPDESEVAYA